MSSTVSNLSDALNNTYPVFEPNQLLTSSHLNQLRNYLDTQDRLSRVKLVGMGIVCGLEVTYENDQITISAGTGITSEGFLVHMKEETLTKATEAEYADPENYPPFLDAVDSITGQIPMWELLPENSEVTPTIALTQEALNIDQKVVVLFVEYKDIDIESCVGQNCDDKGIKRTFTIRKLLLNCEDVDKIIREGYQIPFSNAMSGDDSLDGSFNLRFDQSYMVMPAFTLVPDSLPVVDYNAYYKGLNKAANIYDRYEAMCPDNLTNPFYILADKIRNAHSRYEPILNDLIKVADISNLKAKFKNQFSLYAKQGVLQYFYDYGKDLAKAYNEFVDQAFEITAECCPDETLFPRHLVLGKVTNEAGCPETQDPCRPALYRTHFIQSPIYNQQQDQIKRVRNNFKRLVEMINNLRMEFSVDDPLKITPSDEKQASLQKRSIPFYYQPVPLYKYWNFELSKRCKANWNLGYWSEAFENVPLPSKFPLRFDKDPYNFFRIEGLLGKQKSEVCEALEIMKRQYDLDFDILPLKMRANTIKEILSIQQSFKLGKEKQDKREATCEKECGLTDIREDYLQLRNELINYFSDLNGVLLELLKLVLNQAYTVAQVTNGKKKETATKAPSLDEYMAATGGLISYVQELIDEIPKCLDDFNFVKFDQKWKTLGGLVFFVVYMFESLVRAAGALGIFMFYYFERSLIQKGYLGVGMKDLYRFLNSDADLRISSIYFSYLERLKTIEERKLFSNFVKNNPGLEHMAGVPKGGTFIFVYGADDIPGRKFKKRRTKGEADDSREVVFADFALNGKVCCEESFSFCGEEEPIYPPIARNIYVFIEQYEENQTIDIDIRNHVRDLNVKEIKISTIEPEATSNEGMPIANGVIGETDVEVIKYQTLKKTNFDSFEYKIEHKEHPENTATGLVIVAYMRDMEKADFCFPSCNQKGQTPQNYGDGETSSGKKPGGEMEDTMDYSQPDSNEKYTFFQPDYNVKKGMEGAKIFDNLTEEDNDFATNKMEETQNKYEKLRRIGALNPDATDQERKKYEEDVVNQFKDVMKETSDGIDAFNKQIGQEPEELVDKLAYRVKMAEKIAARDALVMLYEDQTNKLLEIMESQDLGKDEQGAVYKYVDKKMRTQISKMGTIGDMTRVHIAEVDAMDSKRKELFGSYKPKGR